MLDTLRSIVEKIPGAKAAVLMGLDGYAVEKYVGGTVSTSPICIDLSNKIINPLT